MITYDTLNAELAKKIISNRCLFEIFFCNCFVVTILDNLRICGNIIIKIMRFRRRDKKISGGQCENSENLL